MVFNYNGGRPKNTREIPMTDQDQAASAQEVLEPSSPKKNDQIDLSIRKAELGIFGKVFGSSEQAPTNIAGCVAVLCVVALVLQPFFEPAAVNTDTLKIVLLTILAYLFGRGARSKG